MLETVRYLESVGFTPDQARALADSIEARAISRDELRYELVRLKFQLAALIVGANVTVLTIILAALSLLA